MKDLGRLADRRETVTSLVTLPSLPCRWSGGARFWVCIRRYGVAIGSHHRAAKASRERMPLTNWRSSRSRPSRARHSATPVSPKDEADNAINVVRQRRHNKVGPCCKKLSIREDTGRNPDHWKPKDPRRQYIRWCITDHYESG